ncbi:putative serine/threonine-protein kinase SIS8 isoform X2 [Wolffia australiana]
MEETTCGPGSCDSESTNSEWWPPDLLENLQSASLVSKDNSQNARDSPSSLQYALTSAFEASQTLWATGSYSGEIPSGFYSIIPEKRFKAIFDTIPSPDDLYSLGLEGLKAEIILVDMEKDKKLSMLKQLSTALVKVPNASPASIIKKIAGLVSDFYKRPSSDKSPVKSTSDGISHSLEKKGVQLLGQIRHGSCRPRAILFKVLADAAGLESRLTVGLPDDGVTEFSDSYRHMSVTVQLNSVELLVDLMRFPGQLIPFSTRAIVVSHIAATGESDSAENDSCDSPLEPNSPLYGFSERFYGDCGEQVESMQPTYQRKADLSHASSQHLRNAMLKPLAFADGKLISSNNEAIIANAFWRRSRRKAVAEHRASSSSPEHPFSRARGRSVLSGEKHSFREHPDGVTAPSSFLQRWRKSDGAATDSRRTRRRSISMTPEIGDDIVRAVRAMNESMKQSRMLQDKDSENSTYLDTENPPLAQMEGQDCTSSLHIHTRKQIAASQKAMSLPSSPNEFNSQSPGLWTNEDLVSMWDQVLKSSPFLSKPLVPFEEWNIDFSELSVGTRVGIGFFGEVFRGIWNGTDVAIKVFLEQDLTAENMESFCNEISILSRLRHPNVILFLGACMKPPKLSMVTEYMEMGSLYYLIHTTGQKSLSWRRRLRMLRDICRGLMCIHRMGIVHRDLKSANCLVSKHWTVKICDFGLSRAMTGGAPVHDGASAGTPEWMAPELIRNEPFSEKCDLFSFGVIMWELCTFRRPWEGISPVQVIHLVANEGMRLEIPEGPLGKLISDCWAEPEERPSCQEILSRLLDCEYTLS